MLDNDNNNIKIGKAFLVGESGIGKTCIAGHFINDIYDSGILPTQATSFLSKTIKTENNKYIKYDIWDTCGQEK